MSEIESIDPDRRIGHDGDSWKPVNRHDSPGFGAVTGAEKLDGREHGLLPTGR